MPQQLEYQSPVATPEGGTLRTVTLVLVALAAVVYAWTFGREGGFRAIAVFFPFTMLPFVVDVALAFRWRTTAGQSLLLIATLAYAAWFAFVFVEVTYLHPAPQGSIAFLFVGIYAAPVLAILWSVGWVLERRRRAAQPANAVDRAGG